MDIVFAIRLVMTALTFVIVGVVIPKLIGAKPNNATFSVAAISALVFYILASLYKP